MSGFLCKINLIELSGRVSRNCLFDWVSTTKNIVKK